MKYLKLKQWATRTGIKKDDVYEYPYGCSGYYVRLRHGVGVKVYWGKGHKKIENVSGSFEWWEASKSLYMLRLASRSRFVPKGYCVAPIKVNGLYYVGMFMEHVKGEHPNSMTQKQYNRIANRLHRLGVDHGDLGSHNIKISPNGKIQVLDFDFAVKVTND